MSRVADVFDNRRAADLTGVVDDDVTEAEDALEDRRRNRDVLDFAERNISSRTPDQTTVDLELGIGHGIANHVSTDVVIRGNQQQS